MKPRRSFPLRLVLLVAVVMVLCASVALPADSASDPPGPPPSAARVGFFGTADGQIVDPDGRPVILRGVGLGGWLVPEGYMLHISAPDGGSLRTIRAQIEDLIGSDDADTFFDLYREHYVQEKDIAAIDEWGFDHVRLPFHYLDFWDPDLEQIREDGFDLLDEFLEWCRAYDLEIILDMHAAPGAQNAGNISDSDGVARLWTEPDPYQDWTVAIWTEIARRYADETLIIGYDLINEPVLPDGVPGSDLRDLYVRLADAIRAVDPNHILFIEGDTYATDFSAISTPFDDNMVYAFHKYWSSVSASSIQYLLDLRDDTGVPLWLGETGENSNAWFYAARTLAESHGIGWNWWTHKKIATISAPASAPFAPGYADVVAYWRGEGPRPSSDAARQALFAMARGLDLDRTVTNTGVLASLFDDDFGSEARPFRPHVIPGTIHAADYDVGTQGVAYGDQDPWAVSGTPGSGNTGGVYRNDGVDIEPSADPLGYGYNVGWIESLEWLRYTAMVAEAGRYDIEFRVASAGSGGRFLVSVDGEHAGTVDVPGTGGWQAWQSVWLRGVAIEAGERVLKLTVRTGGFNLNTMRITKAAGTAVEDGGVAAVSAEMVSAFPNPAADAITVRFATSAPADVSLDVFDMLGRQVLVESGRRFGAGEHEIAFRAALPAGAYVLRLLVRSGERERVFTERVVVRR